MIYLISGPVNQGKSTRLLSIYQELRQGDGFFNRRMLYDGIAIGQEIIHMATGETAVLSYRRGFIPGAWDEECRFDAYSFSGKGLEFGRRILRNAFRQGIAPLYIDEIGPLELARAGFYQLFRDLVRSGTEIYAVIRTASLPQAIETFQIKDYQLI